MGYLNSLNERQLESVQTTEGPVRVIAGAGTGKTRALTARYCYLTDLLGVDPASILCVTFTNKAAAEMKQRIRGYLGDFDLGYICTFHSWAVRMLKEDIHVLNYPAQFVVIDDEDQADLLQKVYTDLGLTLKEMPIKRAQEYIGRRKEHENYIRIIEELRNDALLQRAEEGAEIMDRIFLRYIYEQKKNYCLDFDDIIIFAHYILKHWPLILEKWQARMQYVMVDEFQDVNERQYEIARMLAGAHRNLFVVGDPDQTIYSWRGADVNLFLDFDKIYPDAQTIVLTENYRSVPELITATNTLIGHNQNRYPKQLTATLPSGTRPYMYHAKNDGDEAAWISRKIAKLVKDGARGSDIAILYRAHHHSRPIEDALIKRELPYVIYSGTAFYARREIKDVLCYLRMLTSADDIAFMRTVNTPSRKIGKKKIAKIIEHAQDEDLSYYEALKELAHTSMFASTGAQDYIDTIEKYRMQVDEIAMGDLMQRMLDASGYEEMLRELSEWERLDNLAELKRAIEEAGHDDDATLDAFLSRAALIANSDRNTDSSDSVRMMTVHTSKGMEFPIVFIIGMNDGSFPSKRSSGPDDIEEERRLAYVAATRAERMLFITASEGFSHDQSAKQPSRFIYEMGIPNLDFHRPLPQQVAPAAPMAGAGEKARFAVGDIVDHPIFGRGTVKDVSLEKQTYNIDFDKLPTLRSMRFGAPLEPCKE